jgi:katanin p80 WD40 repeat-containing subunit B1
MATAGSRKIHEFSAHSTRTNCIRLGRNTAGLLVTGGDDFLVNVWTNGKAGAILSLQGHSSPVTSVSFDKKEESIFAGSEKATIKLFDLEGAKVVRTITGHRAAVTAVDVHSLGNFFASGSQDTNVKLWDRRARECTASYRGHAKGICMLQFSPDGKWVTSASDDCTVKV